MIKIKIFICDNTDCEGKEEDKVFRIVLRKEFGNTTCNWCASCIRRDNDMILTIIEEEKGRKWGNNG